MYYILFATNQGLFYPQRPLFLKNRAREFLCYSYQLGTSNAIGHQCGGYHGNYNLQNQNINHIHLTVSNIFVLMLIPFLAEKSLLCYCLACLSPLATVFNRGRILVSKPLSAGGTTKYKKATGPAFFLIAKTDDQ